MEWLFFKQLIYNPHQLLKISFSYYIILIYFIICNYGKVWAYLKLKKLTLVETKIIIHIYEEPGMVI